MNFFENPAAQSIGSTTKDAKIKKSGIKAAHEVFELYLQRDNKIQETDFEGIYSKDEIAADLKRVEEMKNSRSYEKPTSHSVVLENLITQIAELNNWFGENEHALVQLSEYDDKITSGAHMDTVLEIKLGEGEDEHILRLGFDFTTAVNEDNLAKKRKKCLDSVEKKNLFNIKYFQSEVSDEKGRLSGIPVVIVGMDKETLHELCESVGKKEKLASHLAQFMLLDEILHQLDILVAVSLRNHGKDDDLTQGLKYYREVFINILEKKESLRPENFSEKASIDGVYKYITKYF